MVDLILLERVDKLGQMGQIVKVKPGFARNYLLPQKKAMRATKENLAYFETQRAQLEANNLHRKSEAADVGTKVEGVSVVLIRQAGESGQLYGSVAARDIAAAVTKAGFTVDKRQIVLDRPIKTLGLHRLRVMLHPEVSVTDHRGQCRRRSEDRRKDAGCRRRSLAGARRGGRTGARCGAGPAGRGAGRRGGTGRAMSAAVAAPIDSGLGWGPASRSSTIGPFPLRRASARHCAIGRPRLPAPV